MYTFFIMTKEKIIDFHAHIYPQKIAEKASNTIGEFYKMPMKHNGCSEKLIESGKQVDITKYVVHSAATTAKQVESINNFIISECAAHSEFVGYGTSNPEYENFEQEFKRIKTAGIKGIKLHPDFQHFAADADVMDNQYEVLAALKMPVLFHAGDYRFDYSGPQRIANVIKKHPDLIVIAAHFGGYTEWDKSSEYLIGKNCYMDTSSSLFNLSVDTAMEMIHRHGVEKMLFGSDFPMWDHAGELERFNKLPLTPEERSMILYSNAESLLNL